MVKIKQIWKEELKFVSKTNELKLVEERKDKEVRVEQNECVAYT